MKLRTSFIRFGVILLLPFMSCEKTIIEQVNGSVPGPGNSKIYSIEGYAQKGPFIVGTDVTVSELNNKLFPTGRVFFATTLDDKGYFELPGVVLESQYIQIKIRGRYFSETGGYVPTEELTLYSLADITKSETINVNILTHLEKERVEYLVQEKDFSFNDAKHKAQNEILKMFEWENVGVEESEQLNLSDNNEGGAILLAISSIFEAIDFIPRLETITNFKIDFAQDGTLDSELIKRKLVSSALFLQTPIIRQNMEVKFEVTMPDFESALLQFTENTSYTNYIDVIFPKTHDGYVNLFRVKEHELSATTKYAFIIAPYPQEIAIAQINWGAGVSVSFSTPDNSFPYLIENNLELAENEQFKIPMYEIIPSPCGSGNETCYQVTANGGLVSGPVSSMIVVPITPVGHGKFYVHIDMFIADIYYHYQSGNFTW